MIISSRPYFGPASSWPYSLLSYVKPGLLVDVGAATGTTSKRMHDHSPASPIHAYEPFPGNWPHFEATTRGIPNCTLVKKAASDKGGTVHFAVPSVADQGSSSVGHIAEDGIEVEAARLDEEIHSPIRFLKIDVQGAEAAVVHGASGLLSRGMIDMALIECDGDEPEIIEELIGRGFTCFDSGYSVIRGAKTDEKTWEVTYRSHLTTGAAMFGGWPSNAPRDPRDFCKWLMDRRAQDAYTWTDLFFVAPRFMTQFLMAGSALKAWLDQPVREAA